MKKTVALIINLIIILEIIFTVIPVGAFAVEENEQTEEEEITREYEIPKEAEYDISENGDGSIKAKWTRANRTLTISGTGNMKNYTRNF